MADDDKAVETPPAKAVETPPATEPPRRVPEGYRQGLITAITVLLGFSLAFLRFWVLETPGEWSLRSVGSTGVSIAATLMQLVALFRSLRLEDQDEREYRKTVRWFLASAVALLLALLLAVLEAL